MRIVGYITREIIDILNLNVKTNTPIYIGDSNIEHIKNRHRYEFDKYFNDIEYILNSPDYIGLNPKDGSILYVKLYEINGEYIRIAVKITSSGTCFAKTLHLLSTCNAERYIEKGTLIKLDKNTE
jgi:hypothetical protein